MNETIAKLDLILVKNSGEKLPVSIEIGRPYEIQDGKGADFAKCPVSMRGLHKNISDIAGEDTFQALTLAIAFVRTMLKYFNDDGGKILLNDGKSEFEFGSFFPD